MSKEQLILISCFLAGTASIISGYDHWRDLFQVKVMAGLMGQLAIAIRLAYTQTDKEKQR